MTLIKRFWLLSVTAILVMGAAWDDCAFIPGEDPGTDVSNTQFSDVTTEHPMYVGIRIAEEEGWFAGYPDGTLRPDDTISADQIASVVERLYPDGATRAEVANFLASGSIGVLQKVVTLDISPTETAITLANRGSFPVDLDGYTLSWSTEDGDNGTYRTLEQVTILPGETHIEQIGVVPDSANLINEYSLQITDLGSVSVPGVD